MVIESWQSFIEKRIPDSRGTDLPFGLDRIGNLLKGSLLISKLSRLERSNALYRDLKIQINIPWKKQDFLVIKKQTIPQLMIGRRDRKCKRGTQEASSSRTRCQRKVFFVVF